MTFNGFGTQTAWPDGTCFVSKDREISKGRTYIRDLSQGMNSFVSRKCSQAENIDLGWENQLFFYPRKFFTPVYLFIQFRGSYAFYTWLETDAFEVNLVLD